MRLASLPLPDFFKEHYAGFPQLTPIQEKAVQGGLFAGRSLLACAPTASGKTLIATMAIVNTLPQGKAFYLVPLKALANEKYREYLQLLGKHVTVGIATGDMDAAPAHLARHSLLILTVEKLDSLLRHRIPWLPSVKVVILDELHLLNDPSRGPALEVVITLLKRLIQPQFIGLSATIGNPEQVAEWLDAALVIDSWRPVELKQGIYSEGKLEFW